MIFALGFDDRCFPEPENVFAWAKVAASNPNLAPKLGVLCQRGKFCVAHDVGGFWLVVARDKLDANDTGDVRAIKSPAAEVVGLEPGIRAWEWKEIADA